MDGFSGVEINSIASSGTKHEVRLSVSHESTYYHEHFASFRLLPAVAEIDIVALLAGRILGKEIEVLSITKTKFTKLIVPDSSLILTLDMGKPGIIAFRFSLDDGAECSSGRIGYRL